LLKSTTALLVEAIGHSFRLVVVPLLLVCGVSSISLVGVFGFPLHQTQGLLLLAQWTQLLLLLVV
jgi:hypothetical protein